MSQIPFPQIFVRKTPMGWVASASVALGNRHVLNFRTSKVVTGLLTTTASVCVQDRGFETHRVHQDYYQTLIREKVRVTDKAVEHQLGKSLHQSLDTVLREVRAQYGPELNEPVPAPQEAQAA